MARNRANVILGVLFSELNSKGGGDVQLVAAKKQRRQKLFPIAFHMCAIKILILAFFRFSEDSFDSNAIVSRLMVRTANVYAVFKRGLLGVR